MDGLQAVKDAIATFGWYVDKVDVRFGWSLVLAHPDSRTFLPISFSADVMNGPRDQWEWDRFRDEVLALVRQYPNGYLLAKRGGS